LEETKRLGRVLRIVQTVAAQPGVWTRRRLADEMEVSERTIDNDLALIRHALRYVLCRTRKGYFFEQGPHLRPLQLSLPQVLGLTLAAQLARENATVDAELIGSVLSQLEATLPPGIVPYLRRAIHSYGSTAFQPTEPYDATLATLEQGFLERRRAKVTYRSASDGRIKQRALGVYYLLPYEHSLQVIAHDTLRDEVRMFKVDRIETCELTDETYKVPETFDMAAYLGTSWGVLRAETTEPVDVTLRFSPRAGHWVRDRRWHPSQQTDADSAGGTTLRFHCDITNELVRWVLSFGGEVVVVEPASLCERVVREAERAVAQGRAANTGGPDAVSSIFEDSHHA
jgi:predicted DNA-binding transcriptional regulator YafY